MGINIFLPQVTRIPVTGPKPYNTLVCVEGISAGGPQEVTKGKLSRWTVTVPTLFKLAGFDQRVPPVFDHSTTAWLSSIGPAKDDSWVYAVDEVKGAGFSPFDGSYFVNIAVAVMPGDPLPGSCIELGPGFGFCLDWMMIQVTSFVLCYEPPPPQVPHGRERAVRSAVAELAIQDRLPPGAALPERLARQLGVPFKTGAATAPSDNSGCNCGPATKK